MAHSRLHIICGNWGCNDEMEYYIDPEGHDISNEEIQFKPAVFIICNNCGTLHDLEDFVPLKK